MARSVILPFKSEADLVEAFCGEVDRLNALPAGRRNGPRWVIYHETAGWDLLLVDPETGVQVGLEAKLTVNAKVIAQALPDAEIFDPGGPDYRGILVPDSGLQLDMRSIAGHLGLTIVSVTRSHVWADRYELRVKPHNLPDEGCRSSYGFGVRDWFPWCPTTRCKLPDYLPDVRGGKAAPVMLTEWKVKAIKLLIILERRGFVTRADMRHLSISPTRWTAALHGFLVPGEGGYVRGKRTPDLKRQHPENWVQIEADFAKWAPTEPAP